MYAQENANDTSITTMSVLANANDRMRVQALNNGSVLELTFDFQLTTT